MNSHGVDSPLDAAVEDFLTSLERGENPDQEAYLRRYPDLAEELRAFFDDLYFVDTSIATQQAARNQTGLGRYIPDTDIELRKDTQTPPTVGMPRIGGFELIDEIGSGSQGVVYKAEQTGTKRAVAVKVIREGAFASKAERKRFESEVEFASRLSHPNIVSIYHCGQDAGRDFFAMEFIDGEPLDSYLPTHMLSIRETLDLFLQVCDAVSYAHQRGVIHRDLKPSNILVDGDGRAHILDFGLAKTVPDGMSQAVTAVTQMGDFAGTWYYASPEQAGRDPTQVDVRSDVYALGVILHEMLTDCYPYPIIDEPREVIARHIQLTPASRPSSIRSEVDDELDTIVLFALQKERERRYQSAGALAEDIRRYLANEPIAAKRDSAWYVLRKTIHRYRWPVSAVGVAMAALLAFAVTISILYSQAVTARRTTELRTRVVRESQRYLMGKLDELNYATNRLAGIAEAYPELPKVKALERLPVNAPLDDLGRIVADMPEDIFDAIRLRNGSEYAAAATWIDSHAPELERVGTSLKGSRFVFGVQEADSSLLARRERHNDLNYAGMQLGEAFAARALLAGRRGALAAAVESLVFARSIGMDLANARYHTITSYGIQVHTLTHDSALALLSELARAGDPAEPLVDWVLSDPPLTRLRTGLTDQRHRIAQIFESMTIPAGDGNTGVLDFEAIGPYLPLRSPRVEDKIPLLRRIAQTSSPQDALAALDRFVTEVEKWDDLPFPVIQDREKRLLHDLKSRPAWQIVRLEIPYLTRGFQYRAQWRSKRYAMILTACVVQYRASAGHWPPGLSDAVDAGHQRYLTDPYMDLPFGYRIDADMPVIYAVNEDGIDDGGKPGQWGEVGTDVVLFPPPRD